MSALILSMCANSTKRVLTLDLFHQPIEEMEPEELVATTATLKFIGEQIDSRTTALRERIIPLVKEQGELNESGKTFSLEVESGKASVTVRESNKIDEGRLKALLKAKGLPITQVYPVTGITLTAMKKGEALHEHTIKAVTEALEGAGLKLTNIQSLNEKAVEGLVALGMITPEELMSVTDTKSSDALKIEPDESFLSDLSE